MDCILTSAAYGSGVYVAVGHSGTIISTKDIQNWEKRESHTDVKLSSVTWGNEMFVAVGAEGMILTSKDGLDWTIQPSGTDKELVSVTYGQGSFVAVSSSGTILSSKDGRIWKNITPVFSQQYGYRSLAWGGNGFVAASSSGFVSISMDGENWVSIKTGIPGSIQSVVWVEDKYIGIEEEGSVLASSDGQNWTKLVLGINNWIKKAVWDGKQYVGINNSFGMCSILVSPDGLAWKTVYSELDTDFVDIAYGNGHYMVLSNGQFFYYSSDGQDWKKSSLAVFGLGTNSSFVRYVNHNFILSPDVDKIFTSPDAQNWTPVSISTRPSASDFLWYNNSYTSIGNGFDFSEVSVSKDLQNWEQTYHDSSKSSCTAVEGKGKLVAIGKLGHIITTKDGKVWDTIKSGTDADLNSIAWGSNVFVTVGNRSPMMEGKSNILISTDGDTWKPIKAYNSFNFSQILWNGDRFFIIGDQAVITMKSGKNNYSFSKDIITIESLHIKNPIKLPAIDTVPAPMVTKAGETASPAVVTYSNNSDVKNGVIKNSIVPDNTSGKTPAKSRSNIFPVIIAVVLTVVVVIITSIIMIQRKRKN